MKKEYSLKKNHEFDEIIKKGKKFSNDYFIIFFLRDKQLKEYKIGVSVGKKTGNAPIRNYNKRVIRHILRENNEKITSGMKYVVMLKKKNANFEDKTRKLLELFERIQSEK